LNTYNFISKNTYKVPLWLPYEKYFCLQIIKILPIMNTIKITLRCLIWTILLPLQATIAQNLASNDLNRAENFFTTTEDLPVLQTPTLKDGKLTFHWDTQKEEETQRFELRIYDEDALNNNALSKSIFAEIIKGNQFSSAYRAIGLASQHSYYYTVRAVSSLSINTTDDTGFSAPIKFYIDDFPVCTDPKFFNVANKTTANAITVKWVGTPDDYSYIISYKLKSATTYTTLPAILQNPANNSNYNYTISGLLPNNQYDVKIKSTCDNGNASSNEVSSVFKTTECPAITSAIAKGNVTSTSITISWNIAGSTFPAYEIGYGKCDQTRTYVIVKKDDNTTMSYTLTNLTPGANYCIFLKGMCDCPSTSNTCGTTSYSVSTNEKSTTIQTLNDCLPPNFWISKTTPCKIEILYYGGPYILQYKPASAATWTEVTVNSGATGYEINNVLLETYSFRMRQSCTLNGQQFFSPYTPIQTTTIPVACPKPYVTLSNDSPTSVKVSYFLESNTLPLTVCYRKLTDQIWQKKEGCLPESSILGLEAGAKYMFKIYKPYCYIVDCNDNPSCPELANSIFSIESYTMPCAVPQSVIVENVFSTSVVFSIQNAPNNFSTNLKYRIKGTTNWTTINTLANPVTITNLTPNTDYEFEFQHPCANQQSTFSLALATKTTENDNCVNLSKNAITVKEVTTNTIALEWQNFQYNNLYEIRYKEDAATTWISTPLFSTNNKTLENLTAGKKYQIEIRRKVAANFCD
jgi:hypothetical protein